MALKVFRAPVAVLMVCGLLAACGRPGQVGVVAGAGASNAPPFATQGYAPFSRSAAIGIALREWRAWGGAVRDEPPGSRPPREGDDKPERQEGLWQRVGEYWWLGLDRDRPEAGWTGRHDATGREFDDGRDGFFAWSAAFISYVMSSAGAGPRFAGSQAHATFITMAARGEGGLALRAHPIGSRAPQPGDLVCYGRGSQRPLRLERLTGASFPAHCDIVVRVSAGAIAVVGGNVDDTVAMKTVPTGPDGRLGDVEDTPYDPRYPWFVVLEVLYDR